MCCYVNLVNISSSRPEPTDYQWSAGQCFGTWGCLSASSAPPVAQSTNTPAQATPAAQQANSSPKPASSVSSPASGPTSSPSGNSGGSTGGSGSASGVLSSILKLGMQQPQNDGSISTSSSSGHPNKCSVKNNAGKDMLYVCWGGAGSWVNAKPPIIAQPVSSGQSAELYFANTAGGAQGGACAPVFSDTQMKNGQIVETWVEATFNQYGTCDVSKEVTMNGTPISVNTGSCTSNMNQCVFACLNGASTCGDAGSYQLLNPGPGCSGNAENGGCSITGAMTVTVG